MTAPQEPFDRLIGFPQGACLGVVVAGLLETSRANSGKVPAFSPSQHPPLRFVVSIAGLKAPPDIARQELLYEPKIQTTVLHVLRMWDVHVSKDEMFALVAVCESAEYEVTEDGEPELESYKHVTWWQGGHRVPRKGDVGPMRIAL